MNSPRLSHLVRATTAALLFGSTLLAQVPDGHYVASTYRRATAPGQPGTGGIFWGHPTNPATPACVANLPPEVTGRAWPNAASAGANFVVRRPSDGALVSNGFHEPNTTSNTMHRIFVLTLSGSQVVQSTPIDVGTLTNFVPSYGYSQGIPQAVMLPDERLAIGWDGGGLPGQPLTGHWIGIVDLAQGTVSPVPASGLPAGPTHWLNAFAVDIQGGVAYLGYEDGSTAWIYEVPFPGGGAARLISTFAGYATNLVVDNTGNVLVSCGQLYSIDPMSRLRIQIPEPFDRINAMAHERVTGDLIVAGHLPGGRYEVVRLALSTTGATTHLGRPTGALSGIDIHPDPEAYGAPTQGNHRYTWQLAPNPGGLPLAGRPFSLEVIASPGPMPLGVCYLSVNKAPAGIPLFNIDPGILIRVGQHPPGTIDLGTLQPHWIGATVYLQSFCLDPGAPLRIAATRGLEVTIL